MRRAILTGAVMLGSLLIDYIDSLRKPDIYVATGLLFVLANVGVVLNYWLFDSIRFEPWLP